MKRVNVELKLSDDERSLLEKSLKVGSMSFSDLSSWRIYKKSIDARHKNDIKICYAVDLFEGDEPKKRTYEQVGGHSVIVVGAGPAGLSAALDLARHGVKVTVIERGECVEKRSATVEKFFSGGELDENSNVQFGEGGAGAFSDGKLNTQVNSPEIREVLEDFVLFGAPCDVLYLNKPHIGSDNLPKVVSAMREEIKRLGGEFLFGECVVSLIYANGGVIGVKTEKGEYFAEKTVLAIGHSSRDTFSFLHKDGVAMESKDFSVGFRIEQLQEVINRDRYGDNYNNPKLGAADYKLVSHADSRAVFTFCMCPGGVVVPSSSSSGMLVVNGMSNYLRSGVNANSAVICQVKKDDFGTSALSGVEFQKRTERLAYAAIGGFVAPVQLAKDYISDVKSTSLNGVLPTYRRGFDFFELKKLLPSPIASAIRAGLNDMNGKIRGFAENGAVLTGVETRTSSPVRIIRNEKFESVSHKGLYPCGEGCGYAGGIMSASVDGIKVSRAIIADFISTDLDG